MLRRQRTRYRNAVSWAPTRLPLGTRLSLCEVLTCVNRQAALSNVYCPAEQAPAAQHGALDDVPIQRAVRIMSQKLVTYFEASIPSCSTPGGSLFRRQATASVPVLRARPAGARSPLVRKPIGFRASIYPRFIAVYAGLFYTKCLTSLELWRFDPFFRVNGRLSSSTAGFRQVLPGGIDRAQGGRGTTKSTRFINVSNYDSECWPAAARRTTDRRRLTAPGAPPILRSGSQ